MPRRDNFEYEALQIIASKGSEGMIQCNLWKELGASGRDGSRIALKLEKRNLVRREKELYNGRWTYRIFIKKIPVDIESILDVPCVSCSDISKCEASSEISPNVCAEMTQWLLSISKGKNNSR